MSDELVAVLTAYQIATGLPVPLGTPKWRGTHLDTFLRLKEFFK